MPVLVTGIHVFLYRQEHVDGRDKHGHDDNGENESEKRLAGAVSKREPDSRGLVPVIHVLFWPPKNTWMRVTSTRMTTMG